MDTKTNDQNESILSSGSNSLKSIWLRARESMASLKDLLFSERTTEIMKKRSDEFFECLHQESQKISEDEIRNACNEEEFLDLFIKAYEKAIRTSNQEKRSLYVKILISSCQQPTDDSISLEEFLDIVSTLNTKELKLAMQIFETQLPFDKAKDEMEIEWLERRGNLKLMKDLTVRMGRDELYAILYRLRNVGLLREAGGSDIGYFTAAFMVTGLFRKLVSRLKYSF